jgi:hypothetical protein
LAPESVLCLDQSRLTVAFSVREMRVSLSSDQLHSNEEIRVNVSDGHASHHCYHSQKCNLFRFRSRIGNFKALKRNIKI